SCELGLRADAAADPARVLDVGARLPARTEAIARTARSTPAWPARRPAAFDCGLARSRRQESAGAFLTGGVLLPVPMLFDELDDVVETGRTGLDVPSGARTLRLVHQLERVLDDLTVVWTRPRGCN